MGMGQALSFIGAETLDMAIPSNNVDMPLGVRRFAFHGDKNLCIVLGCKMAIYVATGLKVSLQKIEPFGGARVRYLHC